MIKVEVRNGMLAVTCPFSHTFVSFAKMRGGTWSDGVRQWLFDPRDEFAVRSTLADIYGTDDYESCAKTDVRLALDTLQAGHSGGMAGRVGQPCLQPAVCTVGGYDEGMLYAAGDV